MIKEQLKFYPMKMCPVYKDYLWGGKNLRSFNKNSDKSVIAESWEVSCNDDGLTKIENGVYKNKTLKEVVETDKINFLGKRALNNKAFPLIIKLIDAEKDLSIQVHPSDERADKINGERGKSEFWYIVDCQKDAHIYYGFNKDITQKEFLDNLKKNKVCDMLNKIKVKKGEAYYIPAGTIHALGSGTLVAEIQQNSNTTFRVYDYNRKDCNGNLRELHIERAKDVLNFNKTIPDEKLKNNFSKFDCKYFKINEYDIKETKSFEKNEETFNIIQFIDGNGMIESNGIEYNFKKGDSFFIAAKIKNYTIKGYCKVLISEV